MGQSQGCVSRFEDVDVRWTAGGADQVDVGLIGALGLAHVGHFHQRVDVRIFHVAVGVGGWMARLVFELEVGLIGAHAPDGDNVRIERAVDLGAEGWNLAAVGIGARALRCQSALAMFSDITRMRPA